MKRKIALIIALFTVAVNQLPVAYAAEAYGHTVSSEMVGEKIVTPRADVIVTKFRLLDGKLQYRRWNETRGYWVDPYWIDAE